MVAAIEIYNKPGFHYRTESFAILAINGWELLLKAKWLAAQITNDPDAPAVHLTDEQIREKYPWDYQKLTEECAQRYSDFKRDKTYHAVRRAHVRLALRNDSLPRSGQFQEPEKAIL